jgi:hypothetical protein
MATISIADNDARIQHSIGSGGNTANSTTFTIDFPFFALDDINVIITNSSGVDTTLTRGSGANTFAVAGTAVDDGFSGGNVTLGSVYTSSTVTIFRDIPVTRTTDFATSGPFNIASLNTELDRIIAIEQELETALERTLTLPESDATASLVLPNVTTRKGKTLAFNASSGAVEAGPTISGITTVGAMAADIAALADIEDGTTATDAISGLAAIKADVTTVAGIASNVTSVAGIASNVTTVAGNNSNISTVAGISSTVTSVAGISSAISNVDSNASNINTVAGANSNITTVASNISGVNSFADRYRVASSDPSSSLNDGDLVFNTSTNSLKVYNGSAWQAAAVSAAGLLAVANDLSDLNNATTARGNLGSTAVGDAVFIAASVAAAQQALDVEVGVDVQAYDADTAKLDVAQTFTAAQAGSTQTASITGSTTLDFSVYQNFVLTLTGTVTLDNPTTEQVGQSGFIVFIQDGTGGRTVSLGTDYETAGGSGLTLSTAASATDIVPYVVAANGRILLGAPQLAFA